MIFIDTLANFVGEAKELEALLKERDNANVESDLAKLRNDLDSHKQLKFLTKLRTFST